MLYCSPCNSSLFKHVRKNANDLSQITVKNIHFLSMLWTVLKSSLILRRMLMAVNTQQKLVTTWHRGRRVKGTVLAWTDDRTCQNGWFKQSSPLFILQTENLSSRASADLVSVKDTPLGLNIGLLIFHTHLANIRFFSCHCPVRTQIPSQTNLTLITCLRSHPYTPSHQRIYYGIKNFRKTHAFSSWTIYEYMKYMNIWVYETFPFVLAKIAHGFVFKTTTNSKSP